MEKRSIVLFLAQHNYCNFYFNFSGVDGQSFLVLWLACYFSKLTKGSF